jgi:hypothetical protein
MCVTWHNCRNLIPQTNGYMYRFGNNRADRNVRCECFVKLLLFDVAQQVLSNVGRCVARYVPHKRYQFPSSTGWGDV